MERTSGRSIEAKSKKNNKEMQRTAAVDYIGTVSCDGFTHVLTNVSDTQTRSAAMDLVPRSEHTTQTHFGFRKPLTCSFYLKSFCKYDWNLWAVRGNGGSLDDSSDRSLSLCHTLQTIYCLLTLYLKQFSLLTAEMWHALKSSHIHRSTQSVKGPSSTHRIHVARDCI